MSDSDDDALEKTLDSLMSGVVPGDPLVGSVLADRYRVRRTLGVGGMATVYLAEHMMIGRQVALKVLHPQYARDEVGVRRFLNEGRAAGTLGHPNIVACTDMGQTPAGAPFLVFEYAEGQTLLALLSATGPMAPIRAARIGVQIASALADAHAANIIHRDLKSENVIVVNRENEHDFVKILDFGISRFSSDRTTRPDQIMGTPLFMAPEQIMSPSDVSPRSDIYSLGVILYHMLSGRIPFQGAPLPLLVRKVLEEEPPSLAEKIPGLHPGFAALVHRALAKDPTKRPDSMRIFEENLRLFANLDSPSLNHLPTEVGLALPSPPPIPSPSSPSSPPEPPAPRSIGHRRLLLRGVIAGSVLTVAVAVALFLIFARSESVTPRPSSSAQPPSSPAGSVKLSVRSPTPGASVVLRGNAYPLPYEEMVKPGDAPELVEISAPGHSTRGHWIRLDAPHDLVVPLTSIREGAEAAGVDGGTAVEAPGGVPAHAPPDPGSSPSAVKRAGSSTARGHATPHTSHPPAPSPAPPQDVPALAPGTLDPQQTRAAVQRQIAPVRDCYDRAKMEDPNLAGQVTLLLEVVADGRVKTARVESSTLHHPRIEACIISAAQRWVLPLPAGGVATRVLYPLVLR